MASLREKLYQRVLFMIDTRLMCFKNSSYRPEKV